MPCFHPLTAYTSAEFNRETGKYRTTFNPHKALVEGSRFRIPCMQCHGCRLDKATDWALRLSHHAQMFERSCFLTLTYDDASLPVSYSVEKRALQLFHMRVQEFFGPGKSYYGVGEYGDDTGRPHYHTLLFGVDFSEDRTKWRKSNGFQLFRSDKLESLWPFGNAEIGVLTPESAGYCARYTMKKINGRLADEHYWRVSPVDGQSYRVEPEFALMSRGIGASWFERFKGDVFPSNFLVMGNRRVGVPRYYRDRLSEEERAYVERQALRRELADLPARQRRRANETRERLEVREQVSLARTSVLVRPL